MIAANHIEPYEKIKILDLGKKLNVQVIIQQALNSNQMVDIYNQALVFVYAPINEALGMAPLEALACGIPVIAVAEGGILETINDEKTGYLVPRDPVIFAEKLLLLLENPSLRDYMGKQGVTYIKQHWTWKKAVDKLESEFSEILEK